MTFNDLSRQQVEAPGQPAHEQVAEMSVELSPFVHGGFDAASLSPHFR